MREIATEAHAIPGDQYIPAMIKVLYVDKTELQ
jgi:hypothetical protein